MEAEWVEWMREHAPEDIYQAMRKDIAWQAKWRDEEIARLEAARLKPDDVDLCMAAQAEADGLGQGPTT